MQRLLTRLRQHYQNDRQTLLKRYQHTSNAAAYLREHTQLTDRFLVQLWHHYALPTQAILIAVGGYARCELYPYSDIDILILLPKEALSEQQREAISYYISALWDIGLEVSHSIRTLAECIEASKQDITIQTNMLESRLIIGNRKIFRVYLHTLKQHIHIKTFFEAKLFEQQQRYNRFQQVTYNLEPNIKESPGGLRDLHLINWITRSMQFGKTWQSLMRHGILASDEARKIKSAASLLQSYRLTLHFIAKRREDRILFDYQHQMAERFQLKGNDAYQASERLMNRYYHAVRTIRQLTPLILQTLKQSLYQHHLPSIAINEHFSLRGNLLSINDPSLLKNNPSSIFELFLLFQRYREIEGIETQTLRALWSARHYIDHRFRNNPLNQATFLSILREPRGITRVLRLMNQYDILGRYIPAFGRIVGQMQHDLFHVYTVDEHTLILLRNLRRLTVPAYTHEYPLCSRLLEEFTHPEVLYLAALFHDIAKGRGGDHSILGEKEARSFCELHQLNERDTKLITWLVLHHLKMSFVAQKQDIYDPEVIRQFAEFVGNKRYLSALYLLTVADIRATSPKVWNAWKAKLLEDLYYATLQQLGEPHQNNASFLQSRRHKASKLLSTNGIAEENYQAFWQELDPVYFLRHHAEEIAWHTHTLHTHIHSSRPIVAVQPIPSSISNTLAGLRILIYVADQTDLFARICHFFEKNQYSIIEAKIHTTKHHYALDSFYVIPMQQAPTSSRDIDQISYALSQLLQQQAPLSPPLQSRLSRQLKHFPLSSHILLRPDENGQYHTLSITAGDRAGLLSSIAYVLSQYQINIHTAKIMTFGERAEDIFLISGSGLTDPKIQIQLEQDLLQAVETLHLAK